MASSVYLFPNVNDPDVVPVELEKKLGLLKTARVTIMLFQYIPKILEERRYPPFRRFAAQTRLDRL